LVSRLANNLTFRATLAAPGGVAKTRRRPCDDSALRLASHDDGSRSFVKKLTRRDTRGSLPASEQIRRICRRTPGCAATRVLAYHFMPTVPPRSGRGCVWGGRDLFVVTGLILTHDNNFHDGW